MPNPQVLLLQAQDSPAETYYLSPEKLLSGNPQQTVWMHYTDPSGKFFTGIWRSETGKWNISYTEEEYCHMLEGISVITSSDGTSVQVQAGDSFVIPAGFSGTWEVVATSTKRFVIYEANGV